MTVTATDLHDRTAELTERAMRDPKNPIVVEKRGKPAVVLMDADYYEGLLETLDILSDPDAMSQLRQSREDIKAGRLIPHEQVLKELGLDGSTTRRRRSVDASRSRRPAKNR